MTSPRAESQTAISPITPTTGIPVTVEDVVDQDECRHACRTQQKDPETTAKLTAAPLNNSLEPPLQNADVKESTVVDSTITSQKTELNGDQKAGPDEKRQEASNDAVSETKPSPVFVRPYDSTRDYDRLLEICMLTLGPSLQQLPPQFQRLAASIWCQPYLLFCSSTCFVLHDSTLDKPVGYIIGTPNTLDFVKTYKENYLPLVDFKWPHPDSEEGQEMLNELGDFGWMLQLVYDPDKMITELVAKPTGETELTNGASPENGEIDEFLYPAHLHIDIVPSYQRKGYGQQLMSAFLEKLKSLGIRGVHASLDASNDGAARWYARLGFEDFKVRAGGRYIVKKLP